MNQETDETKDAYTTGLSATYSPEDNKLRLYAVSRLDKPLYERVRAAGFIWAPKQELFVAPMWTPEWTRIVLALKTKIKSPTVAGRDRESLDWRAHLREIKQAIVDSEQASLNAEDWAEIYYALDAESEAGILDKIGPDGREMVNEQ